MNIRKLLKKIDIRAWRFPVIAQVPDQTVEPESVVAPQRARRRKGQPSPRIPQTVQTVQPDVQTVQPDVQPVQTVQETDQYDDIAARAGLYREHILPMKDWIDKEINYWKSNSDKMLEQHELLSSFNPKWKQEHYGPAFMSVVLQDHGEEGREWVDKVLAPSINRDIAINTDYVEEQEVDMDVKIIQDYLKFFVNNPRRLSKRAMDILAENRVEVAPTGPIPQEEVKSWMQSNGAKGRISIQHAGGKSKKAKALVHGYLRSVWEDMAPGDGLQSIFNKLLEENAVDAKKHADDMSKAQGGYMPSLNKPLGSDGGGQGAAALVDDKQKNIGDRGDVDENERARLNANAKENVTGYTQEVFDISIEMADLMRGNIDNMAREMEKKGKNFSTPGQAYKVMMPDLLHLFMGGINEQVSDYMQVEHLGKKQKVTDKGVGWSWKDVSKKGGEDDGRGSVSYVDGKTNISISKKRIDRRRKQTAGQMKEIQNLIDQGHNAERIQDIRADQLFGDAKDAQDYKQQERDEITGELKYPGYVDEKLQNDIKESNNLVSSTAKSYNFLKRFPATLNETVVDEATGKEKIIPNIDPETGQQRFNYKTKKPLTMKEKKTTIVSDPAAYMNAVSAYTVGNNLSHRYREGISQLSQRRDPSDPMSPRLYEAYSPMVRKSLFDIFGQAHAQFRKGNMNTVVKDKATGKPVIDELTGEPKMKPIDNAWGFGNNSVLSSLGEKMSNVEMYHNFIGEPIDWNHPDNAALLKNKNDHRDRLVGKAKTQAMAMGSYGMFVFASYERNEDRMDALYDIKRKIGSIDLKLAHDIDREIGKISQDQSRNLNKLGIRE